LASSFLILLANSLSSSKPQTPFFGLLPLTICDAVVVLGESPNVAVPTATLDTFSNAADGCAEIADAAFEFFSASSVFRTHELRISLHILSELMRGKVYGVSRKAEIPTLQILHPQVEYSNPDIS
jgi:hypothetical protein